ncbi:MAG: formate dehydrogenase accessory sulfurtransferase FdhD [Gammaproteobacteria bacterium]|nr:formate dehydrogenase accessory sulfurtransferase FdhD [Gammaproteobacteria bacterium]
MYADHSVKIVRTQRNSSHCDNDVVATEEPMEIRLRYHVEGKPQERSISITMRTPGNDHELALGFLFTEGIIQKADDVAVIDHCGPPNPDGLRNVVKVSLHAHVAVDIGKLLRNFYTTSSCGVCGKTSLDALAVQAPYAIGQPAPMIAAQHICRAPILLRKHQALFEETGGIHAAGLMNSSGELLAVCEDVGRHNALDKLIGTAMREQRLPLADYAIILSGRASFELLQKSLMAGAPLVAAVGAPSSLAVECAIEQQITLAGFVRDDGFNVYAAAERIIYPPTAEQKTE